MNRRFAQTTTVIAVLLLLSIAVEPNVSRLASVSAFGATNPQAQLSEIERSTIGIFERVSPSVVQVVARPQQSGLFSQDQTQIASGTGFIWDNQGHVVTNDHVVQGATEVAVRLASGEAVEADVVGVAPNYDLAVIQLKNVKQLPAPAALGTSANLK